MDFKKWLEDTGEVRTALITNTSLRIPSKYQTGSSWDNIRLKNPFISTKKNKKVINK
jgi:hypothetical protein